MESENYLPGRWGCIDTSGKMVIPPIFDGIREWEDGMAIVTYNGLCGVIDRSGNFLIKPGYLNIDYAGNGLFIVKIDFHEGLINAKGEQLTTPKYQSISRFKDGLAVVEIKNKSGYIDTSGQIVIPPIFESAGSFNGGMAWVKIDGKFGYINKNIESVFDKKFDGAEDFDGDYAFVRVGEKWGLIDRQGNFVIEPEISVIRKSVEGIRCLLINKEVGYFNQRSGEWIESPKPLSAYEFENGEAKIGHGKEQYVINKYGSVSKIRSEEERDFHDGLAIFSKDGKYGYKDKSGNEVIPPVFNNCNSFDGGFARVQPEKEVFICLNTFGWEWFLDTLEENGDSSECRSFIAVNEGDDWYELTFSIEEGEERKEYKIEDFSNISGKLSAEQDKALRDIDAMQFFDSCSDVVEGILYGNKCWGEIFIPMHNKDEKFDPKKCAPIITELVYPDDSKEVLLGVVYDGRICFHSVCDSVGKTGETIWKKSEEMPQRHMTWDDLPDCSTQSLII